MRCARPKRMPTFDTRYARAIHPCYSSTSAARILPGVGRATSIVTLPVHIQWQRMDSTPDEVSMQVDDPDVNADTYMHSPERACCNEPLAPLSQPRASPNGKTCAIPRPSENSYGSSVWLRPDDELHPISHAHLLVPRRSRVDIPFPIACIAPHDEIYELLSSAVFQKHVLGVGQPMLGFTFDPMESYLQVIVAWLSPQRMDDHECPWRVTLIEDDKHSEGGSREHVERWLRDSLGRLISPAMSDSNRFLSPPSQKTRRSGSMGSAVSSSPSFLHAIPSSIPAARAKEIRNEVRDRIDENAVLKSGFVAPVPTGHWCSYRRLWERGRKLSASQAAKPSRERKAYDLPGEILYDRRVISTVWPSTVVDVPSNWPHSSTFIDIWKMLFLRSLSTTDKEWFYGTFKFSDVKFSLPETSGPHAHMQKGSAKSGDNPQSFLSVGSTQEYYFSKLDEDSFRAFLNFQNDLEYEKALRHATSLSPLLPIGPENLDTFKRVVPTICSASDEARALRECLGGKKPNEAECRLMWDKIIKVIFPGVTTFGDGSFTDMTMERPVSASRNLISDAVLGGTSSFHDLKLEYRDLQSGSDDRSAREVVWSRLQVTPEAADGEAHDAARALREILKQESNRGDGVLSKALVDRIFERDDSVARWNKNTEDDIDIKARVLHSYNLGVCDTLVLAGAPFVFPESNAALVKDFSVIQTVYDAQKQPDATSTSNDDPETIAVDVEEAPETGSGAEAPGTNTNSAVQLPLAPSSMHCVVALAKQAIP
ncbi:hypothetical protein GLOTRDRAFT_97269, partial [Gloeophyllum trabeum ATCC 11539]